MLKYFWTVLFLAAFTCAFGQSHFPIKVAGLVVDQIDRPISSANVYINESSQRGMSNENGQFEIPRDDGQATSIKITAMGYDTLDTVVNTADRQQFIFVLKIQTNRLDAIRIKGKQVEQKTAIVDKLSLLEIEQTKGQSAAEVFSNLGGVSLLRSGHRVDKPVVHGLHSNRILILNQGVKLEGQQWGLEHAPELDPFSADEFELIKGAQAVRYGADALGGVLIARSKPLDAERLQGRTDLIAKSNGRGAALNVDLTGGITPIPGLAWRIQGSGQRSGSTHTPDYILGNTGLSELNFSTSLQYHRENQQWEAYYSRFATQLGVFYGAHVGTVEDLLVRMEHGKPLEKYDFSYQIDAPKQEVVHDLGKLSYKGAWGKDNEMHVQYAWQRNHRMEYDRRRAIADDVPMSDMVLSSRQLDLILKISNHRVGLQASNQVNNNMAGTGTTPFIPNYDQYGLGVFGIHSFTLGRVILEAGWRYDFRHFDAAGYRYKYSEDELPEQYLLQNQRNFNNVSGSLGLTVPVLTKWQYKSHLGLAWRAPNANELYSDGLHHGAAIYEIGRIDLQPEQALKWVHALSGKFDGWSVEGEIYGQWIHNYIYALPHPDSVRQTIRGTFPVFGYQQHNALFYGLDLAAKWNISANFNYGVSVNLVKAKNISQNSYLPYIPSDRFQHDLRWYLNNNSDSYIHVAHEYVSQQRRYEAGTDYAPPPGAFHLFHLHLAYPISWNQKDLQLALGVENLFDRNYKDYMDRFRYYAHREGRNITLSLHFKF